MHGSVFSKVILMEISKNQTQLNRYFNLTIRSRLSY